MIKNMKDKQIKELLEDIVKYCDGRFSKLEKDYIKNTLKIAYQEGEINTLKSLIKDSK